MSEEQKRDWLSPLDQKIIRLRGVISTNNYSCLYYVSDKLAGKRYGGGGATLDKLSELRNILNSIIWHPDVGTIVPFNIGGTLWVAVREAMEEIGKERALIKKSMKTTLKDGVVASTAYPLSHGQAIDYAVSTGGAVIAEVWNTRYTYHEEAACLLCIDEERPAHEQIMGRWRKEDSDHE